MFVEISPFGRNDKWSWLRILMGRYDATHSTNKLVSVFTGKMLVPPSGRGPPVFSPIIDRVDSADGILRGLRISGVDTKPSGDRGSSRNAKIADVYP